MPCIPALTVDPNGIIAADTLLYTPIFKLRGRISNSISHSLKGARIFSILSHFLIGQLNFDVVNANRSTNHNYEKLSAFFDQSVVPWDIS
jgi:hypothetical protein